MKWVDDVFLGKESPFTPHRHQASYRLRLQNTLEISDSPKKRGILQKLSYWLHSKSADEQKMDEWTVIFEFYMKMTRSKKYKLLKFDRL